VVPSSAFGVVVALLIATAMEEACFVSASTTFSSVIRELRRLHSSFSEKKIK
jgi:hypothetical protein